MTVLDRRLPVRVAASLRIGGVTEPASISNLGRGGLSLVTQLDPSRLPPGQTVDIACLLPRTKGPVRIPAKVVWSTRGTDHRGVEALLVGVEFGALDPAVRTTIDAFVIGFFESVLVVDADPELRAHASKALSEHYLVIEADSAHAALRLLDSHELAVVIVGEELPDSDAKQLFREMQASFPACKAVRMVVATSEGAALEDLSLLYRVFYYLRRPVEPSELYAVMRSAVARYWESSRRSPDVGVSARNAAFTRRVLEASRRLGSQRDIGTAGRLAVDAVLDLVDCDRAYCYIYDSISESLWASGQGTDTGTRSAIAGLSGYVARTATAICLPNVDVDPRFQRTIDDPDAQGGERFMAEPILSSDKRALGLLIAIRNAQRPAFEVKDTQGLAMLSTHFAPTFGQMALQTQIEHIFTEHNRPPDSSIFRQTAVDSHRSAGNRLTRPLALSPRWVGRTYRVLIAASVAFALFLLFGTMGEYADGPAIVRIEGRLDITATEPGIVAMVPVQPGQRVDNGAVLLTINSAKEQIDLERIQREFDLQLVKSLREPGEPAIREALSRLRSERDFARSRLDAKTIRAPHDGVVNDVRIRPGQNLSTGDPILSITGERAEPIMTAILPGQYRPLLRRGQAVRLEVTGFRYAYAYLQIENIGDEVVGPEEVRRFLGKEVADTVQLRGPVVLVRAHLQSRSFTSEGKTYNFHDGMQASAEVRIRTQRIIVRLIPALQKLTWLAVKDPSPTVDEGARR